MRTAMRIMMLASMMPLLSSCGLLIVAIAATAPDPRTSIDVVWAEDHAACQAAVEGEPSAMQFVGVETAHYAKASNASFSERRNEVWRVPTDDPSFVILDDAGRAVFDFDNDGELDLVYTRGDAIFFAPATREMRDAFESGTKPEATLAAGGFQVLHRSTLSELIDRSVKSSPYVGTGVSIQRAAGVTYLRMALPEVPFDANRPTAPKYSSGREPNTREARLEDLYRMGPGGAMHKACRFLVQVIQDRRALF